MDNKNNIDVIVIGAGPSGLACAITVAKGGNRVLVIEKSSDFGTKNMFGGACYIESIKELTGDEYLNLPYERILTEFNYVALNNKNSIRISYRNPVNKNAACITRYALDSFLAAYAKKLGVYFALDTLCVDLIKHKGRIIGVKTEFEEIKAPMVVIAEGFNSLIAIKSGLKQKTDPKDAILGIKEVIRLDNINSRFNLEDKNGAIYQFFTDLNKNSNIQSAIENDTPFGMGFLYTFKNTVTLGLGISMKSLQENKVKPYEYLDRLKKNDFIFSLIKGGEVIEYSAHSIPEGGYKKLPALYDNGVLLTGDCANLVNSIHFEGTNLAIKSGILAGETCNLAIEKKNFSKPVLKNYKKKLFDSFVIQDLKTYKNVISTLYKRKKSVFSYYPEKIDEFFKIWTDANNIPKKNRYRSFLISFFKNRKLKELIFDFISFVKCALEALI